MAIRKPLVIINGQMQEAPAGDTLSTASSEVDVVGKANSNAGPLTTGMALYVKSDGSVDKASASSATTKRVLGLVKDGSIAAAAQGLVQTDGVLTLSDWTAVTGFAQLTAGAMYFLSATAGQLTTTPPTTAGQYVCSVGMALNQTDFEIDTDRMGVLLA